MVASDFEVNGADRMLAVSKALKAAGETGLRKQLNKGLRDGAKPLIPKARSAARAKLPQSGGLADQVAREPIRIRVKTGRDPAVSVVIGKRRGGAIATNKGVIRHPVFGRPGSFVSQQVPSARGWFDDEMEREAPSVRPELERVINDMAEQIVRDA